MVRELCPRFFRAPWPFVRKGPTGIRKIGPATFERRLWPGQNKEFPELSPCMIPRFREGKPPLLNGWHEVEPAGYTDPNTGKFVKVPEMITELVVPDLTGFKLKPYVSFRTDVEIRRREKHYLEQVAKLGERKADEIAASVDRWPPPPMDPQTLFDLHYAEGVRAAYLEREKRKAADEKKASGGGGMLGGLKMRLPFLGAKRSLHTSALLARGPTTFRGWFPRDHQPGPYPKNEEEHRAAAIRYGLRPEDYKPIHPDDVKRYAGDYPELGIMTWEHRDPYEDYSYRIWRRNWNEPVIKDYLRYRPDRSNFTGLEIEDFTTWKAVIIIFQVILPLIVIAYYVKKATIGSFRWKNPAMPKQYPYDYHRAWPLQDCQLYPIVNYTFEPLEE